MTTNQLSAILDVIERNDYDPRPDECREIDEYLRSHDLEPTDD